jgi:GT2 family glycosyltransferase
MYPMTPPRGNDEVNMKQISIVIVTWNCRRYIEECLDSLAHYRRDPSAEIIVVDNASSDGTPEFVRESYPEVLLVDSKVNLGFPRGTNVGIQKCSGKYLFLINPDVRVLEGCIEKMLTYLETNPRVGLLGPRMLGGDGLPYRSYMGAPTLWSLFCRALALDTLFPKVKLFGGFLKLYFDGSRTAEVDILNGWFWGTRKEAVSEVGLLDDQLFMYADDLDWSKRFRDAGWKVIYFAEASSIHYGGGTTARAPIRFAVEMQRANFQYWQKNYGRASQFGYLLVSIIHQAIRLVGSALCLAIRKGNREEMKFKQNRAIACLKWAVSTDKQDRQRRCEVVQPEATS